MQPQQSNLCSNQEEGELLNKPKQYNQMLQNDANHNDQPRPIFKKYYFWLSIILLIGLTLQIYLKFLKNDQSDLTNLEIKPQIQKLHVENQYLKKTLNINEQLQQHQDKIAQLKKQKQDLTKQYNVPDFIEISLIPPSKTQKNINEDIKTQIVKQQPKLTLQKKQQPIIQNKQKIVQKKQNQPKIEQKKNVKPKPKVYQYGDFVDYPKLQRMKKHKESISSTPQDLQRGLRFHQLLGQDIESDPKLKAIAEQQKAYYNKKYNIDKYKNQLQICLIITSYNNEGNKRYLANLDSVYSQQYENYFVIYVNDASTDSTGSLVEQYINEHPKAKERTLLVNNTVQKRKSRNQYQVGHQYCKLGSIMYVLDGDDTIIGRQFFKLLSAIYQQKQAMFVYLNYLQIKWQFNPPQLHYGYNGYLDPEVIKTRTYRQSRNYPINPRTWMTDIFFNISFQGYTHNYKFVPAGEDLMLMPSLLQLAGDRIVHLPDVVYYYNTATGMNDNSSKDTIKYRFGLLQEVVKLNHMPQYKQKVNYRLRDPKQLKKKSIKIRKNQWVDNEYNRNSQQLRVENRHEQTPQ